MNRYLRILLAALALWIGCSKTNILTPRQFTKQFAEALLQSSPGLKVKIVNDLEIHVTSAGGGEATMFLDNAYTEYKQDPATRAQVIQKFIAARSDITDKVWDTIDRNQIIPVIKDRPWLQETRKAMLSRGAKDIPEYVYEDFSPDLVIVYAADTPNNISYLFPKKLEDAKIDRKDLRKIACENLKRLLPKIERHGTNGVYMLTAGGTYEASILLLDSVWNREQMEVNGDIVVAIPTRDLLMVTGSKDPQGIEALKQVVKKAFAEGSYHLTQKLFVYRNGKFEEFKGGPEASSPANTISRPR